MYGINIVYTTFDVLVVIREQKSVGMVLLVCILLLTHMLHAIREQKSILWYYQYV